MSVRIFRFQCDPSQCVSMKELQTRRVDFRPTCVCAKQYISEIGEAHNRPGICFNTRGRFVTSDNRTRGIEIVNFMPTALGPKMYTISYLRDAR
jgi:hypothetical protein